MWEGDERGRRGFEYPLMGQAYDHNHGSQVHPKPVIPYHSCLQESVESHGRHRFMSLPRHYYQDEYHQINLPHSRAEGYSPAQTYLSRPLYVDDRGQNFNDYGRPYSQQEVQWNTRIDQHPSEVWQQPQPILHLPSYHQHNMQGPSGFRSSPRQYADSLLPNHSNLSQQQQERVGRKNSRLPHEPGMSERRYRRPSDRSAIHNDRGGKDKIIVLKIHSDMTSAMLRDTFSIYGEIRTCVVARHQDTGKSKGFGFISYIKKSDAERAIAAMNGRLVCGRYIHVKWFEARENRLSSFRSSAVSKPDTKKKQTATTPTPQSLAVATVSQCPDKPLQPESIVNEKETCVVDVVSKKDQSPPQASASIPVIVDPPSSENEKSPVIDPVSFSLAPPGVISKITASPKKKISSCLDVKSRTPTHSKKDFRSSSPQKGNKIPSVRAKFSSKIESKTKKKTLAKKIANITRSDKKNRQEEKLTLVKKEKILSVSKPSKEDGKKKKKASLIKPRILKKSKKHELSTTDESEEETREPPRKMIKSSPPRKVPTANSKPEPLLKGEDELFELCSRPSLNKKSLNNFRRLVSDLKIDVNSQKSYSRNTPILELCYKNKSENLPIALEILLERKDLNLKLVNSCLHNALTQLCRHYPHDTLIQCVQLLLKRNINVDHKCERAGKSGSALSLLLKHYSGNHLQDIIRLLVERMADRNEVIACAEILRKRDPLQYAKIINEMVKSAQDNKTPPIPSSKPYSNEELLTLCANWCKGEESTKIERFRRLVTSKQANLNCVDSKDRSPLMLLCQFNTNRSLYHSVKFLLQQGGVQIDLRDKDESDAMLLLCQHYRGERLLDIIQLLLENGSKLTVKNKLGCTPIYLLCSKYCEHQFLPTLEFFMDHLKDKTVNTAAMYGAALLALSYHFLKYPDFNKAVGLLVKSGANVNALDIKRRTALIVVCTQHLGDDLHSFTEIVRLLVASGADIKAVDSDGRKAVDILIKRGYPKYSDMVQLVLPK